MSHRSVLPNRPFAGTLRDVLRRATSFVATRPWRRMLVPDGKASARIGIATWLVLSALDRRGAGEAHRGLVLRRQIAMVRDDEHIARTTRRIRPGETVQRPARWRVGKPLGFRWSPARRRPPRDPQSVHWPPTR